MSRSGPRVPSRSFSSCSCAVRLLAGERLALIVAHRSQVGERDWTAAIGVVTVGMPDLAPGDLLLRGLLLAATHHLRRLGGPLLVRFDRGLLPWHRAARRATRATGTPAGCRSRWWPARSPDARGGSSAASARSPGTASTPTSASNYLRCALTRSTSPNRSRSFSQTRAFHPGAAASSRKQRNAPIP